MSSERSPSFPDVPTAREQGYDVTYSTMRGLSAPKGTPREIVELLADAVKKACESPTFIDFMDKNGFAIHYMGPEEFTAHFAKTDADNKISMELGGYLRK
ncbi:MAG: tripartite tricarboxylate transporter substrate-binding protein, partial [Synergistaceae bacterium]|nr:tripartite tricarboxylate transporter substrate-binding protein [Synergistaceae bacterium]